MCNKINRLQSVVLSCTLDIAHIGQNQHQQINRWSRSSSQNVRWRHVRGEGLKYHMCQMVPAQTWGIQVSHAIKKGHAINLQWMQHALQYNIISYNHHLHQLCCTRCDWNRKFLSSWNAVGWLLWVIDKKSWSLPTILLNLLMFALVCGSTVPTAVPQPL